MPFRLPPVLPTASDPSRRWLWLALVTGLLALALASLAMAQGGSTGAGPIGYSSHPAGDAALAAHYPHSLTRPLLNK